MRKGIASGSDTSITKSLRMTSATYAMIASFNTAVAAMSMLALLALSVMGQTAVYIVLFAFISVVGSFFVSDVLSRSNQTVTALRAIGATRKFITKSMITSLVLSSGAGSALGAAAGAGLGSGLGALGLIAIQGSGLAAAVTVVNGVIVVVLSLAAMGLGVYSGVRRSWRG